MHLLARHSLWSLLQQRGRSQSLDQQQLRLSSSSRGSSLWRRSLQTVCVQLCQTRTPGLLLWCRPAALPRQLVHWALQAVVAQSAVPTAPLLQQLLQQQVRRFSRCSQVLLALLTCAKLRLWRSSYAVCHSGEQRCPWGCRLRGFICCRSVSVSCGASCICQWCSNGRFILSLPLLCVLPGVWVGGAKSGLSSVCACCSLPTVAVTLVGNAVQRWQPLVRAVQQ